VLHTRNAALATLRIWNDPAATFRTGGFSLMFVAAWNSFALAVLIRRAEPWWECDESGAPVVIDGATRALSNSTTHR
jgi:hypothetical protein